MRVALPATALAFVAGLALASCGEERGSVSVQGGTTATTPVTATAPVRVDTTELDPARLEAAMAASTGYGREQAARLVRDVTSLKAAVDAGSVARAKRAYAVARAPYERIEPLVALFPELDGKIDAREDDFPRKAADPGWTGFHPIERALWRDERITARTRRLAAGLVRDARRLDELLRDRDVPPQVVIPGTAELVDEVEESKITGEEERYSKLDLPTFLANLEGSRTFFSHLEPLVREADPALADQVEQAFAGAFAEVGKLREGGEFVAYDELLPAQQRAVKQRIEALAEPLARVQGTLGVS